MGQLNDDIAKLLGDFGLTLNNDTRSNLRKKLDERASKYNGRKRTSRLEASVNDSVSFVNGGIRLTLTMNDYWEVVNDGRSPNNVSEEGQAKIADWSAISGLAEKLRIKDLADRKARQKRKGSLKKMPFERAKKAAGFLVARSLKHKSIEPTHFFDEIIKDGRIEELKQKLTELIKTDIIIEIRQQI